MSRGISDSVAFWIVEKNLLLLGRVELMYLKNFVVLIHSARLFPITALDSSTPFT